MIHKRLLNPPRQRRLPGQFSWIDQRLVRDNHLSHCASEALALYLLLVTVSDAQGLSYYSDQTLRHHLSLSDAALHQARQQLQQRDLIAFEKPLYQVLSLDAAEQASARSPHRTRQPEAIIHLLRGALTANDKS